MDLRVIFLQIHPFFFFFSRREREVEVLSEGEGGSPYSNNNYLNNPDQLLLSIGRPMMKDNYGRSAGSPLYPVIIIIIIILLFCLYFTCFFPFLTLIL